jgi:hydroxyethylthiazole kinase-like uncharacterized protein yjeF
MQLSSIKISQKLPKRAIDSHKGMNGSIAIIGGDKGMTGAALMAARSALLTGAGRTYLSFLDEQAPSVDIQHPEIMVRSPNELSQLKQLDCVVIGPGLGLSKAALTLLEFWLAQETKLLIDADALNLIAKHEGLVNALKKRKAETVITPHPGEASRLLKHAIEQEHRIESAIQLAKGLHVTCVLKGAKSIIVHHDGRYFINTTGNAGLASAGTGDVLSGIIGSLMAQGLNGLDAASAGVYIHGAAADVLVASGNGPIGLTASEVALAARNIINQLNVSPA